MTTLGQLLYTQENLDAEAIPGDETELAAAETATEVAEVGGQAIQQEAAIDATDSAIADAEVVSDDLEGLQAQAEETLAAEGETVPEGEVGQDGEGMSLNELQSTTVALESLMRSIGMPIEKQRYTAESMGSDKRDRRALTQEAIGKIADSAKTVGASIIAGLKAALNTVMNFLSGLLRNRALMERHLVNLQGKVKALGAGGTQKEQTFKAGAKGLSVNGAASPQTADALLKSANKLIADAETIAASLPGGHDAVVAAIKKTGIDRRIVSGGRVIEVKDEEGGSVTFKFSEPDTADTIAAPTPAQMSSLLASALDVIKKLRAFEKTQTKLKDFVNNLISRLQEGYHKAASAVKSGAGKVASTVTRNPDHAIKGAVSGMANDEAAANKRDARLGRSLMGKVGGTIPGAVFSVVKAVADYVTHGLNNYKAAPAENAAPAA